MIVVERVLLSKEDWTMTKWILEIKLRAIESNGFDGEVPLKPLSAVRKNTKFVKL